MIRLVVIPCSGAKLDRAAPAGELYVGSWHQLARRAADAMVARGDAGRVVILSALHGLVDVDRVVEPYDVRLGEAGIVPLARRVAGQLIALEAEQVVGLVPSLYRRALALGCHATGVVDVWPLDGCAGVGYQRQRLAAIARGEL